MSDNNINSCALGVFDSGLGGLTAVREIMRLMPGEDIIYFGDTGRVPYGNRSEDIIIKYGLQDVRFLLTHKVKAILIACGTVSSVAISAIKEAFSDIPIFGVVEATCRRAHMLANSCGKKDIGIIATAATVKKDAYGALLNKYSGEYRVRGRACAMFVPLVENGYTNRNCAVTRLVAKDYLSVFDGVPLSSLILGCTHYPLIADIIDEILNEGRNEKVELIDSGYESAVMLGKELSLRGLCGNSEKRGRLKIFVSDRTLNFEQLAGRFLGSDGELDIEVCDIEKY